jgi:plasmid stabilization system protein ParE
VIPRAIWTPIAESELDEILYYISIRAGRPEIGEENYFAIRDLAADYARSGAPRFRHPVSPPDWFYFRHKRWLIFYRLQEGGIEVMRVIDGSRDLPRQLKRS